MHISHIYTLRAHEHRHTHNDHIIYTWSYNTHTQLHNILAQSHNTYTHTWSYNIQTNKNAKQRLGSVWVERRPLSGHWSVCANNLYWGPTRCPKLDKVDPAPSLQPSRMYTGCMDLSSQIPDALPVSHAAYLTMAGTASVYQNELRECGRDPWDICHPWQPVPHSWCPLWTQEKASLSSCKVPRLPASDSRYLLHSAGSDHMALVILSFGSNIWERKELNSEWEL